MKFEFEIPEEHIKQWIENAATDYVYDRAKQIAEIAIERHMEWQTKLRYELYDDIRRAVADRLGVDVKDLA